VQHQFTITNKFVLIRPVPGQDLNHYFTRLAQTANRLYQHRFLTPRRTHRTGPLSRSQSGRQLTQIQAKTGSWPGAPKGATDIVVSAATDQGIVLTFSIERKSNAGVITVAADISQINA
jgi:hypothetical protein